MKNNVTVIVEMVSKMERPFPELSLDESTIGAIRELDQDPVFVTLPLLKEGHKSRNGITYTRVALESLAQHINNNRTGANFGHIPASERSSFYALPKTYWLKAEIVEGMLWAKGYVSDSELKRHVRLMKVLNAPVATSIYGTAELDDNNNVITFMPEKVDWVDPERAGNTPAIAVPTVTSEMEKPNPVGKRAKWMSDNAEMSGCVSAWDEPSSMVAMVMDDETIRMMSVDAVEITQEACGSKKKNMEMEMETNQAQSKYEELVAEIGVAGDGAKQWVQTTKSTIQALNSKISELKVKLSAYEAKVAEEKALGESAAKALEVEITELLQLTMRGLIAEKVGSEAMRPLAELMVKQRQPKSRKELEDALDQTLASPEFQQVVSAIREAAPAANAGQSMVVPVPVKSNKVAISYSF